MNVKKDKTYMSEMNQWVCLWQMDNGYYLKNDQGDYYCAQGKKGDSNIENAMRAGATAMGFGNGRPVWKNGRKITDMEWEVQMERLMDGKEPDERAAVWERLNNG